MSEKRHTPAYKNVVAVFGAFLVLLPGSAFSQSGGADALEEIIVVAQKREQKLQDVALAITAIPADELRQMTFSRTEEVVNQVPSLEVETQGVWTIRGVGGSGGLSSEQKTAVVFDDVYWYWTASTNVQMFDMAQVEVLKGPQGTLFGRNATGGVVHFRTAEPTDELEGYVDTQIGEYNLRRIEGAISGPLSEKFTARLAVLSEDSDGWVRNRIGPDLEDMDATGVRLKINANFNDAWSSQIGIFSSRQNMHGYGTTRWAFPSRIDAATGLGVARPDLTDFLGWVDPSPDNPWVQSIDPANENEVELDIGHVKINYDGENLSIASITSYMDGWQFNREDVDHSPNDFATIGTDIVGEKLGRNAHAISQEFRVAGGSDRFIWLAGLYYLGVHANDRSAIDTGPDFIGDFCICSFGQTDIKSTAIFAQTEFMLTGKWRLTTGLRYTDENVKEWEQALFVDLTTGDAADDGFLQRERDNDEKLGARLALDYSASDDVLLYIAYNRGAKAGGFNGIQLGNASTFDDEVLNAYQFGLKSTFLADRAVFNAEVFHYDYEDFQASTFGVVPGAGTAGNVVSAVFNREAEVNGLDADFRLNATENLALLLGLSVLDGKVFNLSNGVLSFNERQLQRAPDFTVNAAATYDFFIRNGGRITLHGNARFSDKQQYSEFNHPDTLQPAYQVVNASVGYAAPSGKWDVSLWVKNATDEIYFGCGDDISEVLGVTVMCVRPPRQSGLSWRLRF